MSHTPPNADNQSARLQELGVRLERIEDKLDSHLERTSRSEADIQWIKGHLKLSLTAVLAVIGYLGTVLSKYILGK